LDDLLQKVNDTLFDNPFADQHRFDYFEPSDNEDDDMLNSNVMVNDDDEIIPSIPKFIDVFWSSFNVSND
jgi:hypothetical protein